MKTMLSDPPYQMSDTTPEDKWTQNYFAEPTSMLHAF